MKTVWGMSKGNIACIINGFSVILLDKFKYGFDFDTQQFSAENCKKIAEAIYKKSWVYKHIVGFVDGTMQKIHIYCLKYQAIVIPDDITSSLLGPFTWSTHNIRMFDKSRTLDHLILHLSTLTPERNSGLHYIIYGNQAYRKSPYVYRPFTVYEIKEHLFLMSCHQQKLFLQAVVEEASTCQKKPLAFPCASVIFLEKKEKQSADEKYGETLFIDEKRDDLLLLFAM
ncbi:hypothetical protein PHYBLDRAFT_167147 [Phycomyces blakesleeanus NRRL 1555(-)]|uniref:DDE Tnp4 domain-containing protein n=1 Tax=Phycomyces blakesleeanus (strain ATCC 8743b / DSM 1359 / FGSC 10004 / NBRC 33097 / NRRL 1555) TaxID=763407 RepID=A0A162UFQ0_PHYB8|nr:hypothetical protein PHYBLDRAFT_167147 [Phycomyces blakesleeanus NRRL 1555(-)]OAD74803.1 hypothetical protein PHYBLDRAFT_167147 [Phycomyces blakesleeanus NRRL 1555(-)]|eukprot:XP_018292843.1 hypothetical protein PHYBLDRAFT_167147 [Phycomyces blakesleeanus NRRL 1555(-)]